MFLESSSQLVLGQQIAWSSWRFLEGTVWRWQLHWLGIAVVCDLWQCSGQDGKEFLSILTPPPLPLFFFSLLFKLSFIFTYLWSLFSVFSLYGLKKASCSEILASFKLVALVLVGENAGLGSAARPSVWIEQTYLKEKTKFAISVKYIYILFRKIPEGVFQPRWFCVCV